MLPSSDEVDAKLIVVNQLAHIQPVEVSDATNAREKIIPKAKMATARQKQQLVRVRIGERTC